MFYMKHVYLVFKFYFKCQTASNRMLSFSKNPKMGILFVRVLSQPGYFILYKLFFNKTKIMLKKLYIWTVPIAFVSKPTQRFGR